jgi:hypothetical protein
VLQRQWKNATSGEKFVVLGAAIAIVAWLLGVAVNGIWWDAAGAQTLGLLAVTAAVVAVVVVLFNGASDGSLPSNYGAILLILALVVIVFVALTAWSVFSLNSAMGSFADCVKKDAAACAKVGSQSINDFINEMKLIADSAGVGQKTVTAGSAALSGLLNTSSSSTAIPSLPVSTLVATVGLIVGAASMAWGSFQQWTTGKAAAI